MLSLHLKDLAVGGVKFVSVGCDCSCDTNLDVEVLMVEKDGDALTIDFVAHHLDGALVCADATIPGGGTAAHVLARVDFVTPDCPFSLRDGLSPCVAQQCADGDYHDEVCMQYMSEYCAHRPEDAGCLLVVPFFRRSVGERTKLTLHKAAIAPYAELGFVPSSCSCGAGCAEDEFFATFSLDGDWFELGDAATISLTQ